MRMLRKRRLVRKQIQRARDNKRPSLARCAFVNSQIFQTRKRIRRYPRNMLVLSKRLLRQRLLNSWPTFLVSLYRLLLRMLLTVVSTYLPSSRMSILLELSQEVRAVPKISSQFLSVIYMQVTLPFYKVSLTSLFQYLFNFELVIFFYLEMECRL